MDVANGLRKENATYLFLCIIYMNPCKDVFLIGDLRTLRIHSVISAGNSFLRVQGYNYEGKV